MSKKKSVEDNRFDNPIYKDQSIVNTTIGIKTFSAAFTPYGMRNMDSDYLILIYFCKNKKQYNILRKSIKENSHLHKEVKDNLLLNLSNHMKDGFKQGYLSKSNPKMSLIITNTILHKIRQC